MDEDDEILSYAQELYGRIGPGRHEPDSVSWDPSLSDDRVVVRYGEVTLPQRMRGKLRADQWRPLASAIFYSRDFRRAQRRGAITRGVLPAGLGEVLLLFALLQVFMKPNAQSSDEIVLVTLAYAIFVALLAAFYSYWIFRTLQYEADERATAFVGRDSIVESLLRIRDIASTMLTPKRRYGLSPNINQRIRKLQKLDRS